MYCQALVRSSKAAPAFIVISYVSCVYKRGRVWELGNGHTPVQLDGVCELLAEPGAPRGVWLDDDVALVGEDLGVPFLVPGIGPGVFGPAVDEEGEGVFLRWVEVLGVGEPSLELGWG